MLDHRCLLSLCWFLCVILHTMWPGKSLQLLCILPFGMLCLSANQYDVCKKKWLAVGMLVGMDSVSSQLSCNW